MLMLMLLVQEPYFENHCIKVLEDCNMQENKGIDDMQLKEEG